MRIGMFADMYMPHVSGVTNHILLTKRELERRGHDVYVLTFGNLGYHDAEENVVRSPGIPWGRTGWQASFALSREATQLARTLDIAHAHHPFQSARLALRTCEPAGVPVVITNHTRYDLYSDAYAGFVPREARMAYLRASLRGVYERASAVIAPSPGIVEWLRDFGVTDAAVLLENGIDTQPFANPSQPRTRGELGLADDAVVFCYLGRLGPEKNLPLLADAFVLAAQRDPHVALLLVGDGPSRPLLTERLWAHGLSDRVHFAGATPYAQVPDFLAAADVFVTASVSEVHPLVVLEAMAAGLPAIGVDSPGISDIIEDGSCGLLCEAATAEEIARQMLALAGDDALRRSMATAARARAARNDITVAVDTLEELYERVKDDRRRPTGS